MKKLMVLGAGPAQVPLIRTARAMGLETVVATIPGDYPGIAEADSVSYTDITDPPAIARAAAEHGVAGVCTCCFELGLRSLAYTCEKLALPGLSQAAAEISVDKLAMKRAFDAGGVRSAPWRLLKTESDLPDALRALGLPAVIKAVDLQGSSGVYVVRDLDQAREAFRQAVALSGQDHCLAETFLSGENCGAEAFVQNGRVLFVMPDGTVSASQPGGPNIPVGHYVPLDCGPALHARICAEVEKAIRACGLDDCAVNVDLVLHGDEPYIIELTGRAGATCLPELTGIYYGINYYQMLLAAALGQDAEPIFSRRRAAPRPCAAVMLQAPRTGVVRAIRLPETLPGNVHDLHLIVGVGDSVRTFARTGDRIGQAIVSGDSLAGCRRDLDRLLAQIQIEVE